MAKIFDKMLNFVGWETEEEDFVEDEHTVDVKEEVIKPQFLHNSSKKSSNNKVVNIHSNNQFKLVITQPESFEDAQEVCDHLKSKKPVVVNLEDVQKEDAQRIVDFISGSVYALDGNIQKVASGIFVIAPNNVDLMGEFKDEFRSKGVFPWAK